MAELADKLNDFDMYLFARKESAALHNEKIQFIDEYEKAKILMIYGKNLVVAGSPESTQVL